MRASSRPSFLTTAEVAWLLQMTERRIRVMAADGTLTPIAPAVGSKMRFAPDGIDALLSPRSALLLNHVLAGRLQAPRAEHPWQQPPPLHIAHVGPSDGR